jgi:dihydropteroate synthase
MTWKIRGKSLETGAKTLVMGILNCTPDSISDGGKFTDVNAAVQRGKRMLAEGADIIDVGGESSRPGSLPVSVEEELARTIPVIKALAREIRVPLSIDTTKAVVARAALDVGATIVNDISALRSDATMMAVAAEFDATVILMHMQGEPRSMQADPHYDDLIGEIHDFLAHRKEAALRAGIIEDRLILDPGIGFGKRLEDNFELLARLNEFGDLGAVLVGPSRKAFIGNTLNVPVAERIFGTAGAAAVAVMKGADIIRVHDVKSMIHVAEIVHQCLIRIEPRDNDL